MWPSPPMGAEYLSYVMMMMMMAVVYNKRGHIIVSNLL